MNEDVEFVPIKEREVKTYVIRVVVSAFTDDIDAEVEVSESRQSFVLTSPACCLTCQGKLG